MVEEDVERFTRSPTVTEREVGENVFLVEPDIGSIFQLDAMATAVWRLLENPITVDEIIDTVCAAFPKVPLEDIEDDIIVLLEDLEDDELIICCDD